MITNLFLKLDIKAGSINNVQAHCPSRHLWNVACNSNLWLITISRIKLSVPFRLLLFLVLLVFLILLGLLLLVLVFLLFFRCFSWFDYLLINRLASISCKASKIKTPIVLAYTSNILQNKTRIFAASSPGSWQFILNLKDRMIKWHRQKQSYSSKACTCKIHLVLRSANISLSLGRIRAAAEIFYCRALKTTYTIDLCIIYYLAWAWLGFKYASNL